MRILVLFLLFPLLLSADPIEDLDETEADGAVMILEGTYLLDYCDCCDDAPLRLVYAEKVTREECSYNSEKWSVRVLGPVLAVFQVDEWGKLKPGAKASAERFNEVLSKNYTYVYFAGRAIPLGRRLYSYFDFCQGFVQFPSPALLPAPNTLFEEWYAMQPLKPETMQDAVAFPLGAWRLDSVCSSYGDCQAIPADNQPIWHIAGSKLTVVSGDTRDGAISFSGDMTGKYTLDGHDEPFAWFLAPDNTLILKQVKKGERSFLRFTQVTRYVTALSGLRLRSAPSLDAPVTATIPYGTAVELLPYPGIPPTVTVEGFEGEMLFVKTGNSMGYMFSGMLCSRPVHEIQVITSKMAVLQYPDSLLNAAVEYAHSPTDYNSMIDDLAYYASEAYTKLEESKVPYLTTEARLLEFRTGDGKKFMVNCEARGGDLLILFDGKNAPSIHYPIDLTSEPGLLNKVK